MRSWSSREHRRTLELYLIQAHLSFLDLRFHRSQLHVEWWLHILVELIPRGVLGVISLAWGRPTQKVKSGAGECFSMTLRLENMP